LAGADPYREDQLGGLSLSISGLRERDETVIKILRDADVPVASTTAGGYALSKNDTVEIHCNTIRVAKERLLHE
jgi:acetoin utilization deacetylase AcuC-like enzyme